jgi:nitroimidazol reductase NimA-like FMN-containing flavoprotein (pyridoxamine 5'-phosphate oxidase superfamily)
MILAPTPNAPLSFRVIEEPNIGLYVEQSESDRGYSFVLIDGEKWAIKNKQIKHYRRENVSKVNRGVKA